MNMSLSSHLIAGSIGAGAGDSRDPRMGMGGVCCAVWPRDSAEVYNLVVRHRLFSPRASFHCQLGDIKLL